MSNIHLISAIGTPLNNEERLDNRVLQAHLEDQWSGGVHGVLVAGTMGLLQLLRDETYRELIRSAARLAAGRGELLIGAGDAGLARTRDRIALVNELQIDGVVVLCPYFVRFSQPEIIDYYQALADYSRAPVYLYHLPVLTGVDLEWSTVERLAEHPNIRGIKCSCSLEWALELRQRVDEKFRVIVAQAERVAELAEQGVEEHLDGIFALAPAWIGAVARAAQRGDWHEAQQFQAKITQLLAVVREAGVFPAFTALLNARGFQANFAPAPYRPLSDEAREQLLVEPIVVELLQASEAAVG